MGPGIERLVHSIENVFTGNGSAAQEPVLQGAERQFFYNTYPQFDDENNLSMVVFLKCHGTGVMFPGDLEKAGFLELLKLDAFRQALLQTNVYVASHHGRENGCCEETVPYLKNVYYVVISDKGYQYDTQKTVPFYSRIAKGGPFGSEPSRKVLTTRNDGRIAFRVQPRIVGATAMTLDDLFAKVTDPYERPARLYPALLALLPLLTLLMLLYGPKATALTSAVTVAVSCGGLYLTTNLCRELGKRLEENST